MKNEQKNTFKQRIKEIERKIVEANECAKMMKKNISFSYQLVGSMSDSIASLTSGDDSLAIKRDEIQIQVLNFETDNVYVWSTKKFYDKLEMMKDMINTVQDGGSQDEPEEDPFSDRAEPLLIGQVFYKLEPLAYLIDNPATISIIGQNL